MLQRKILYAGIIILAFLWMLPFYSTIISSVKEKAEIMQTSLWSFPKRPTLDNFYRAWTEADLGKYSVNSFIMTFFSVIGALFLSSLAGFALARYEFKANRLLLAMFIGFNLTPPQIRIVPVFRLSNLIGIYDTHLAFILYQMSFQTGWCTFFLRNFMRTIPTEIAEAGVIDGCSALGIYLRIYLPLTVPAFAILGILEFTWVWNNYLWAITLLKSSNLMPVTAGIANLQGQYYSDWSLLNAAALISIIPPIVLFLLLQKGVIKGLTTGATK